jgi:hypothetical protein
MRAAGRSARWVLTLMLLTAGRLAAEGANYLIVTHDEFYAAIQPLAAWRAQKGMQVRTVKLSELGDGSAMLQTCTTENTENPGGTQRILCGLPNPSVTSVVRRTPGDVSPDKIRDYIVNAWNTWIPRPEYVLLVGDVGHLPVGQTSPLNSDNYYANMDDHFAAELSVGRFPCRTEAECQTMLAKTLDYERWPSRDDTLWYRRGLVAVRFDHAGDTLGYYVRDLRYVTGLWRDSAGFFVDSLFWRDGTGWHGQGPDEARDIAHAMYQGRGYVLFRGFGTDDRTYHGWNVPMNLHPESLHNGRRLPVVYGGCCQTVFAPEDRGVGEAWLRAGTATSPLGAVAYLGNSTHCLGAPWRSKVIQGFFKAAFLDDTLTLGRALFFGKDSLYRWMKANPSPDSSIDSIARYIEQSIMGDPALQLWTDVPRSIEVQHPGLVPKGPCTLRVAVLRDGQPCPRVLVSAEKVGEFHAADFTGATGEVLLPIDPRSPGLFTVTATGRNLRPYEGQCEVETRDVGATAITAPAEFVDSGAAVVPICSLANTGQRSESYEVLLRIGTDYEQSVTVSAHAPHTCIGVTFPAWTAGRAGLQVIRCSTRLAEDDVRVNDRRTGYVLVTGASPAAWHRLGDLPFGDRGRAVKDGGCLAYGESNGEAYVYALKGNRTGEFYRYSITDGRWQALDTLPATGASHRKRPVRKGACLVAAGSVVFAAKGGNTVEWWRYDSLWSERVGVPSGQKKLREGVGAAAVRRGDTDFVYLLKASGTREFYRCNVRNGIWETMADAPPGSSGHPFKNGSALAFDGVRTVYALKGKDNEFFAYDPAGDRWTTRAALPLAGSTGRRKKAGAGAGLASLGGPDRAGIYALKGGGTNEFWKYEADSDYWFQMTDMPEGGGRRVRAGGALASSGLLLYALKGNNTREFLSFGLAGPVCGFGQLWSQGVQAGSSPVVPELSVSSNPVAGRLGVRCLLPAGTRGTLKLYDMTGRMVKVLLQVRSRASSELRTADFARGIYTLVLETAAGRFTHKLVVR